MNLEVEKAMNIIDFVVTGSRAYGPTTPTSDLDIVLYYDHADMLEDVLKRNNIEILRTEEQELEEYSGYYFSLCGIPINIIVVKSTDNMDLWRKKTEAMRSIPPIKDKLERITVFRHLISDWKED